MASTLKKKGTNIKTRLTVSYRARMTVNREKNRTTAENQE